MAPKRMNRRRHLTLALIPIAWLLAGCGQAPEIATRMPASEGSSLPSNYSSIVGGNVSSSTATGNGSGGTVIEGDNRKTAAPQDVQGLGYNEVLLTVRTGNTLKVKFAPLPQQGVANGTDGSSFKPLYSQLGVYISVNGNEQATPLLYNGYLGGAAMVSPVLDFSSSLPNTCSGNKDCRQNVVIKIAKPNYDYWCLNYGMGCSHTHVYPGHPWYGKIWVETSDARFPL